MKKTLALELFRIGNTPISLATVVALVAIIFGTFVVSKVAQRALTGVLSRRGVASQERTLGTVVRLLHYIILMIGFGIALDTAGIKIGALFAAGAVFAVGIGFAMQNIAQNFVSGVILMLERTIRPGDVIEVKKATVKVIQIGIRTTLVRSGDEEDMIVPNATLVQSTVKNLTLRDTLLRVRVPVGVSYSSDIGVVKTVLERVGEDVSWRDKERAPLAQLVAFGASSVNFELSVWTRDPWQRGAAQAELRERIWGAFQREKISMGTPDIEVHFDDQVNEGLKALAERGELMTAHR